MSGQVQVEKSHETREQEEVQDQEVTDLSNAELDEDVDDILDEIDSVLEENAEEFVKSYIQKGGQ